MLALLDNLAGAAWNLTVAMAPWLLAGFVLAGLLEVCVPRQWISRHLAPRRASSVLKGVLVGVPLPLCSCSVIPVAASLKQSGASRGSIAAFTASTPQTGVDSIAATYSLMGLPFTLARIASDVIAGLAAGLAIHRWSAGPTDRQPENSSTSTQPDLEADGCASETACADAETNARPAWRRVLRIGLIDLPVDLALPLVVGIALGAAFTVLLPANTLEAWLPHPVVGYLAVTLLAIPVYVCATGSIPVAFGMLAAGLTPGAVLVFLVAGPATNTTTLTTLLRLIGRKATAIYLFALIAAAWLVGAVVDGLGISVSGGAGPDVDTAGWLGMLAAVGLLLLLANALGIRFCGTEKDDDQCCG
ncbi:MAG: permease [Opitutales bacterium]